MNEQPRSDDLFTEGDASPKRENPYLKKNKKKPSDSPSERRSGTRTGEGENSPSTSRARRRSFSDWMFEHVKVIAALATALVILTLVVFTDVVDMVQELVTHTQQADKEELSLAYVRGLSERGLPVTWKDLESFRFDQTRVEDSITRRYPVKGMALEIWISGASLSSPPSYVYLYNMENGERLVLGEGDLDDFLEGLTP